MIILIITILLLLSSQSYKESFLSDYCLTYKDCNSCASASGCSWCPKAKVCLDSTTLKSTDRECNQMNTVTSAFLCKSEIEDKIPPEAVVSDDILYDWALYKNKITDKIPPPNVYTTEKVGYSNEDVVSNANNVRNDIKNLNTELPGIVASSVENNIKPMVKGILADNYYIQG
jgi:hypothetical protein